VQPLPPLLPAPPPVDPEFALKVAQTGQEMLRKDFYSAAFIIMGAAIVLLAVWIIWLQVKLTGVQELRVKDMREVAVQSDQVTEATTTLILETQKVRRALDGLKGAP
jgi:hypothetical protein